MESITLGGHLGRGLGFWDGKEGEIEGARSDRMRKLTSRSTIQKRKKTNEHMESPRYLRKRHNGLLGPEQSVNRNFSQRGAGK